ncbi:TIGR02757 family protein [Parabacteroides sp. PF5-9]|uniref:TIGR02757 family protein n=1 Tax=Parabacteroides sp. PF5-9 TaxID=1742404 RepID=UPI0024743486|nr:TIGR02757 family protein [Parabacteroides sp. PF5-9]MDH6356248.1 uncharacterized protein (TIGR02757 family) [Parabacteroides sp. PF5-9]
MPVNYSTEALKELLDLTAMRYNAVAFIEKDPILFPHRYKRKQDIEISAFLTATIAWGKRSIILKSAAKMHDLMGNSPYDYIMGKGYERLEQQNIHRTFFSDDMAYLCRGLHAIYQQYDSCESLFSSLPGDEDRIWKGISLFRTSIYKANEAENHKSLKHISNPAKSACKRMHLALRWLVRNDGIVDLGLWKALSPAELFIPLDTHVISTARSLGLLLRTQNDRKAVEELTTQLRRFNATDPILYDFALFGLGESKSLGMA